MSESLFAFFDGFSLFKYGVTKFLSAGFLCMQASRSPAIFFLGITKAMGFKLPVGLNPQPNHTNIIHLFIITTVILMEFQ